MAEAATVRRWLAALAVAALLALAAGAAVQQAADHGRDRPSAVKHWQRT
jgi:hypothetical protein